MWHSIKSITNLLWMVKMKYQEKQWSLGDRQNTTERNGWLGEIWLAEHRFWGCNQMKIWKLIFMDYGNDSPPQQNKFKNEKQKKSWKKNWT